MPVVNDGLWTRLRRWLAGAGRDEATHVAPRGIALSDHEERARHARRRAEQRRRIEVLELEAGVRGRRAPRALRPEEERP